MHFGRSRQFKGLLLVAALTLIMTACGESTTPGAAQRTANGETGDEPPAGPQTETNTTVRVDITPTQMNFLPMLVAREMGFFNDHNITLAPPANSQGGPASNQLLVSNNLDMALIGTQNIISNFDRGQSTPVACGLLQNLSDELIVSTSIETPSEDMGYPDLMHDLKGLKIGIPSQGSLIDFMLQVMLQDADMGPSDVELVTIGKGAVNQLRAGTIDVMLTTPDNKVRAENGGFGRSILNTQQVPRFEDSLSLVYVASPEFAESAPDAAQSFCQAIGEAIDFIQDDSNIERTTAVFAEANDIGAEEAAPIVEGSLAIVADEFSIEAPTDRIQSEIDFARATGLLEGELAPSEILLNQ